jgi:hypothetical protein
MSYNTKRTIFDNYLLDIAAKIGDPSDFDLDYEVSVHDQVAEAIDAYIKHSKHNQKTHGNRGGGGLMVAQPTLAGARVKFGKARSAGGGAAGGGAAGVEFASAEAAERKRLTEMGPKKLAQQLGFELEGTRVGLQQHDSAIEQFTNAARIARENIKGALTGPKLEKALRDVDAIERKLKDHMESGRGKIVEESRKLYTDAVKEERRLTSSVDTAFDYYEKGPSGKMLDDVVGTLARESALKESLQTVYQSIKDVMNVDGE